MKLSLSGYVVATLAVMVATGAVPDALALGERD
jgi:hypothetical protein